MLRCTSKTLIYFFSNALDVMLQNQHYSFLKPHSNLVLIECNTETGLVISLVCYFIEIKIPKAILRQSLKKSVAKIQSHLYKRNKTL